MLINLILFTKFFSLIFGHLSFIFLVHTITNQIHYDFTWGVLFNFEEPLLHIQKGVLTGYVVNEENNMSSSVENPSYRPERFLACGVPDLQFDNFLIHAQYKRSEFNADRNGVLRAELVIHHFR